MGALSAALTVWDIHNQRIISSMGMGWDDGAPVWPYQTPNILLFTLNTPAYFVANFFRLIGPLHYVAFLPAIIGWWFLVGLYLDKPLRDRKALKAPIWGALLSLLAILLVILGVAGLEDHFRWWWTYPRSLVSADDLIMLRLIAPSIWCFVLSVAAQLAAKRRIWSS